MASQIKELNKEVAELKKERQNISRLQMSAGQMVITNRPIVTVDTAAKKMQSRRQDMDQGCWICGSPVHCITCTIPA